MTGSRTGSHSKPPTPAILRRAQRAAAILHWRQAGASMAVIARGLGIGIAAVHRTLRELRSHATRKETDA